MSGYPNTPEYWQADSAARGTRRPHPRRPRKQPSRRKFRGGEPGGCVLLIVALPALVAVWAMVYGAGRLVALGLSAVLAVGP